MVEDSYRELACSAGMLLASEAGGRRVASFYLMNTSMNRNRWGVTDKAVEEGGPTVRNKPLGMGAGYRTDKHYPNGQTMDHAKFVRYEKNGSYLIGDAEGFEDNKVWADMKSGKLGPVSVVIHAFDVRCSECGAAFPASKGVKFVEEHACIKDGSGYEQVHSFTFKRVDFVDNPAYPQAGLSDMCGAVASESEAYAHAVELLAGVYESQEPPQSSGVTNIGAKKSLPEKELEEKMANLEQANQKLQTDFEAAKQASAGKDGKIKALEDKLAGIEKEKHDTLVAETLAARREASIAGKEDEEKAMLAALDDKTLAVWKADALKVASITKKQASTPTVSYGAQKDEDEMQAAVEKRRVDIGFSTQKQGVKN